MGQSDLPALLSGVDDAVRRIALRLRDLLTQWLPEAVEEFDPSANLIAFTYQPGTYRGLIVAIAPHKAHVNLMFARGVELLDQDPDGLLTGSGKKARHIPLRDMSDVDQPGLRALVASASAMTPRS